MSNVPFRVGCSNRKEKNPGYTKFNLKLLESFSKSFKFIKIRRY